MAFTYHFLRVHQAGEWSLLLAFGTVCLSTSPSVAVFRSHLGLPGVRFFDWTVRFFGDLSGQKCDAKPDN